MTMLWSLPISTLAMTSQFPIIFQSEHSMKSFLVFGHTPWFFPCSVSVCCLLKKWIRYFQLFSSAKSRSLIPLSFLLPAPKGTMHFMFSFIILTPISALKSPITMWRLQAFLSIAFSSYNMSTVSLSWSLVGSWTCVICSLFFSVV